MKVVIFGTGNTGRKLKTEIEKMQCNDDIVAYSDNNPDVWGKKIDGIQVLTPNELSTKKELYDCIIVASVWEKEIQEQLFVLNLDKRLYVMSEYMRKIYSENAYLKRYNQNDVVREKVFGTKIVVYTAIMGEYDDLNEPLFHSPDIDYVCFSNNKKLKSEHWNIEYVSEKIENVYLARKIKLFPNVYFRDYDTSIWIDGKFQVVSDPREYVKKYERSSPMLCFPHFSRNCIYDEAAELIVQGIGIKEDIIRQVACYYYEKYPFANGLYDTGCIVRNHNDERVKKLMSEWWKNICEYSYRDQLSFPYVCWQNVFLPDICNLDIYGKHEWLLCTRRYSKDNKV